MNLTITNDSVHYINFNNQRVDYLYYGNDLVWPTTPVDYSTVYFTIMSLENDNTIYLSSNCTFTSGTYTQSLPTVYCSFDNGNTWQGFSVGQNTSSQSIYTTTIGTLNAGQKILVKCTTSYWSYTNYTVMRGTSMYMESSKTVNVYGNTMSLLYGDDFINKTSFPSSTLSNDYGVTALPVLNHLSISSAMNLILPATTLTDYCYDRMFESCTSLVAAPSILPATILGVGCYSRMFSGCTSLIAAPELPAATLVQECYYRMFYGCKKLNYIKCLATNISATSCVSNWTNNVAATGIFVKKSYMSSWTTGNSGIPSGWTVQNAAN